MHHPFSFFWMIDPISDVASHAFAKHFLNCFRQEITIVLMQNRQPWRQRRNPVRKIEIENRECFGRPIVEDSIWPQRPASHMPEPFSFAQIKFASLDIG